MTEYEPISHEEAMELSKESYMERCKAWIAEFNNNEPIKVTHPSKCPVHIYIVHNHLNCGKDIVPGITTCEICGSYNCPSCGNHLVSPVSRITGYINSVDSWNAGKQQELSDRVKHNDFE